MRKTLLILAAASLMIAEYAQAIPLRELIDETIAQEHYGVLTEQEIN